MALYTVMKGPVTYTVVGSPTITDGVVSDFTYDDYFKTAESISTTGISSFEFYARVKTPSAFAGGWCRICNAGSLGNQGTTAGIFGGDGGASPYFHLFGRDIWQQKLTADTWYRIQYICSQTEYTATVYDDNGNVLKSFTANNPSLNLQGVINFCQRYQNFVLGAIDLNNTYIKVNGQLWFGNGFDRVKIRTAPYERYTVVGSPTITDGVASGFSNSNYLKTPQFSPGSSPWEIVTSFTLGTLTTGNGILTGLGTTNSVASLVIPYSAPQTIVSYLSSNGTSWNIANGVTILSNLQANTKYVIKMEFTGTAYNWYLKQNNSWELLKTIVSSTPIYGNVPLLYGNNRATNYPFNGSIDLNNSYIKVNGQYWWRGDMQYVETWTPHIFSNEDYFIENGKLIQVNSNIYCQSTGTQYIKTGILPSGDIGYDIKFLTNNSFSNVNNQYGCIFGGRYSSGNNDLQLGTYSPSGKGYSGTFRFGNNQNVAEYNAYIVGNEVMEAHFHNLHYSNSNNASYDVSSYNWNSSAKEIYLFGLNNSSSFTQAGGGCYIYRMKIEQSGVLVRDFVPVPSGLVIGSFTVPSNGMFDLVNQQFYANQGSGNFTIGKDE